MKKNKCVYCGNNPKNHFISKLIQTTLVIVSPVFIFFGKFQSSLVERAIILLLTPYIWFFVKVRLWGMNKDIDKAHTERSKVIWIEAAKRGIEMEQFVVFGKPIEQYRAKIEGKWQYFESIPIPPKMASSSYTWMDDKWLLKNFFKKRNIPVPFGRSISSFKEALKTLNDGTPPFIIKPQLGSRGRHTTTHIYNEKDLELGYLVGKTLCHFVIMEEQLHGSVYRGTYVGGEVVGILRGDPARITGNGVNTIEELIQIKNENRHPKVKEVLVTPLLKDFIGRQGFELSTILEQEKTIDLSEKIGLSYGGYAVEEFTRTHPKTLEYIKKAGDALGAPVVGFDFIISDITKDPDLQRWGIIEANSLPFINLHHFPMEGEPINVAGKVWDLWESKK